VCFEGDLFGGPKFFPDSVSPAFPFAQALPLVLTDAQGRRRNILRSSGFTDASTEAFVNIAGFEKALGKGLVAH